MKMLLYVGALAFLGIGVAVAATILDPGSLILPPPNGAGAPSSTTYANSVPNTVWVYNEIVFSRAMSASVAGATLAQ